jgi:hypothetical protein
VDHGIVPVVKAAVSVEPPSPRAVPGLPRTGRREGVSSGLVTAECVHDSINSKANVERLAFSFSKELEVTSTGVRL